MPQEHINQALVINFYDFLLEKDEKILEIQVSNKVSSVTTSIKSCISWGDLDTLKCLFIKNCNEFYIPIFLKDWVIFLHKNISKSKFCQKSLLVSKVAELATVEKMISLIEYSKIQDILQKSKLKS